VAEGPRWKLKVFQIFAADRDDSSSRLDILVNNAGTPFQSSHLALPRMGLQAKIADLVVFLASEKSSYATGAEFNCDGGEVAGVKLG
jgi:hypothetical protein